MGKKKKLDRAGNPVLKIAGAGELDLPKSDSLNIWDEKFGWILKDGKPTNASKAYWEAQRRKLKQ